MSRVTRLLQKLVGTSDAEPFPLDFSPEEIELCRFVEPYTMTSRERVVALHHAVEYVLDHRIEGDIVECGVWKGGSMMTIAKTLLSRGEARELHLFDTFEGMSEPTSADRSVRGRDASDMLEQRDKETSLVWAYSALDEVKSNMARSGYDEHRIHYVKGKVEDTIPDHAPAKIALLRLDTDWYESTYHELVHLYPRLSVGGVMIIDDYGHWQGARKAVDQYMQEHALKLLLHRIDYTARACVKLEA